MACNKNHLTLAVAGSRKTQGIVEACAAADKTEKILVLTYTTANQIELRNRISTYGGDHPMVEVWGWFSFLLSHFVRPFLPLLYEGKGVRGFDFKSPPRSYTKVSDWKRYFNQYDEVRKAHLPQLSLRINEVSAEAPIRRLTRMYDRIFIDEVQDLCGYDLEILKLLIQSQVPLEMVGDIRQAILATNEREAKNKQFMFINIWKWFKAEEQAGRISITQRCETWRCAPSIGSLADSLFTDSWGFDTTISKNHQVTGHDGIFLVKPGDVDAYVSAHAPLVLRHSSTSGKAFNHMKFINFGEAKGLSSERVLIYPTVAIERFVQSGGPFDGKQASRFYVAVTRAEQSVAIILDNAGNSEWPFWTPSST